MKRIRLHVEIQEERSILTSWTFDEPRAVTLGHSPTSSVWLLDAMAGASRTLFEGNGNEVRLRVASDLSGELQFLDRKLPLDMLRDAGLLRVDARGDYVVLKEKTSGTILLGSTQVRFWVTHPPEDPEFPRRPLLTRIFKDAPLLLIALFLLSSFAHQWVVKTLRALPPPAPIAIEEGHREFARFLVPPEEGFSHGTHKTVSSTTPAEGKPQTAERSKPVPASPGGLLAAVVSSRPGGKASPFAGLFTTENLGPGFEKALAGRSLEDALVEGLKRPSPVAADRLGKAPQTTDIAPIGREKLPDAKISKQVSGPTLATLSFDTHSAEGSFDPKQLEEMVSRNSPQLRECYEQALRRNPQARGKVVVALVITPEGKALSPHVDQSTMGDAAMERCILSRIGGWTFPRPTGNAVSVRFPFIFSAGSRG